MFFSINCGQLPRGIQTKAQAVGSGDQPNVAAASVVENFLWGLTAIKANGISVSMYDAIVDNPTDHNTQNGVLIIFQGHNRHTVSTHYVPTIE